MFVSVLIHTPTDLIKKIFRFLKYFYSLNLLFIDLKIITIKFSQLSFIAVELYTFIRSLMPYRPTEQLNCILDVRWYRKSSCKISTIHSKCQPRKFNFLGLTDEMKSSFKEEM